MNLELFMKEECPFCQRVLGYIQRAKRTDVHLLDVVKNPSARERLIREGGKDQVPCLFIDGKPLYESRDIMLWLASHPQ